jgi:hypothetical protein
MRTITGWEVVESLDTAEVHVIPREELTYPLEAGERITPYETTARCFCQPEVEVYNRPLFIHRGFEN